VGEGDSELLVTPHGKTILVDGGDSDSGLLTFLIAHQVDHIDLMIATHPHADHIGGLIDVLANFPVQAVATNGRTIDTFTYERFLDQVKFSGADYEELAAGNEFTVDGVSFSVLEPEREYAPHDLDNTSLVIMARCYQTKILLTGDMEADEEKELLAAYASSDLQAQILKVAHHGSNTSSTFDFILAVKPEAAIYSAGQGNPYHHPHPSVINRLLSYVPAVYGTDKNGTISVSISPAGYAVELEKK
jgi:competence protein ComEC